MFKSIRTLNDYILTSSKQLLTLLRTASPAATLLATASTFTLLIKIFIFDHIPEVFAGAYKLGIIGESILASIIASYVFYLIVVHIKEEQDRSAATPYLTKHCTRIVALCKNQLSALSKASNKELKLDTLTASEINESFSRIDPNSKAPMSFADNSTANWIRYFYEYAIRSQQSTKKILAESFLVDTKTRTLTTSIGDCFHFERLEILNGINLKNKDLSIFHKDFFDYCQLCNELEIHMKQINLTTAS